jgi:hypothetical protein
VIPTVAFNIPEEQITEAKPPGSVVIGQSNQPIGNLIVLNVPLSFIPVAGLANLIQLASEPYRYASFLYRPFGHLTPARWPYHFFVMDSCRISALSLSSAYIFLSRVF